ncbi:hypothetical protein [Sporosarcina sp. E16_8]|uniref:hypothetical protein n=1 Tax=Sporosarcina sp. E16_8 TaxID=2789295 RepID=UPI001A938980|nr:hypothetical protein [Sporosarcina sp. E16_8]MBO0586472.1 hypothetical protein [Sporosarcina sp. E16_8]
MRLPIEDWIEDLQSLNIENKNLFEESITCYKASAYKAALLFSFLGFQQIIKERILNAERPDYYQEQVWESIKRDLRKEEAWDTAVNEAIKKRDDNKKIFNISDDIRQQAIYWRYRRNDCAHSKPNIIKASHVEAFWFFLISNLTKFVVEGSKDSLTKKIKRHFDLNYTRDDADFMYLIREIPSAIQEDSIDEFITELNSMFAKSSFIYPADEGRAMAFLNEIINLNTVISRKLIEFIKGYEQLELYFLAEYPEKVSTFYHSDTTGIRNLWRVKLNKSTPGKLSIFTSLILNGYLGTEKEEAIIHFINNNTDAIPTEIECGHLLRHGYFRMYESLIYADESPLLNDFNFGNGSIKSIIGHLDIIDLSDNIVQSIQRIFQASPFPNKLRIALNKYFSENSTKKSEYIAICLRLGIDPLENII